MINRKGKLLVSKKVKCATCQSIFTTDHSMGTYCSNPCARIGWRKSWVKYGKRNKEKRLAYSHKWYRKNKTRRIAQIKKYHATPKGKLVSRISDLKSRRRFPEKYRARLEIRKAIMRGDLIKQPCSICGTKKNIHAHHDNYSKPFKIKWFCRFHHKQYHDNLKRPGK